MLLNFIGGQLSRDKNEYQTQPNTLSEPHLMDRTQIDEVVLSALKGARLLHLKRKALADFLSLQEL